MSDAQQLFVVYGTIILLVGLSLGTILGFLRMKAPPIRTLATAHVETLMQAPIHLALAFVVGAVGFESGWATWGAGLFVAGSGLQASCPRPLRAGDTVGDLDAGSGVAHPTLSHRAP